MASTKRMNYTSESDAAFNLDVPLPMKKKKKHKSIDRPLPRKLYVILENAQLEIAKVGKSFELLSSDKHGDFLRKHQKDPADFRPDITHQCLLMLLDSPLNRSNLLQVYVHTVKNVLIEINPQTRIPRTFDRFAGLMVQLLHKLKIRASESSEVLLKVVKSNVENHLPIGCRKIGTSFHSSSVKQAKEIVPQLGPIAIVVGAMSRGKVSVDYVEEEVKLSNFPLSAAITCAKLTDAFEECWEVF